MSNRRRFRMKRTIFWIGVIVLVVGIVLFAYGYVTIQNMYRAYGVILNMVLFSAELKQQWDLANLLQPIGLGISVLGAIMLAYGLLKK